MCNQEDCLFLKNCENCNSNHRTHDNRKTIVIQESKTKYTLKNPNEKYIDRYKLDNCFDNPEMQTHDSQYSKTCDYLVLCETDKNACFIELKGKNYKDAIDQISDTIKKVFQISCCNTKLKNFQVNAKMVLTRQPVPNIEYSGERALQKLLKSKNNGKFERCKSGQDCEI